MKDWMIQGIGFVGLILAFVSFQNKQKQGILFYQILASLAYLCHFFLLGAFTGSVMNLLGAVRNGVFYQQDQKGSGGRFWLYFFIAAYIASTVWTWKGYYSLLPMTGMIAGTISFWMKDPKWIRLIMLISPPCWFTYNLLSGSIPGMMTEVFNIISLAAALIRFDFARPAAGRK
ncbi:inner membrane protein [Hydrogenispora ethanolica]|jgi:hypothetical protein|uniref:Inner membrane protein n=1 Tax=Hydrogenispora ethanolica TaxID=1082276 RepID=A0A4R1RMA8_HYDET|nr:YgjV family protein [Hydrogenispora ethanolica]TCL67401.1 inner membrane protein [Hydrogenispora ethanolica]